MSQNPTDLKRPVRVVWFIFLGLSAFFTISLPFQDDVQPDAWPLALGYCAFLPACAVGIARLGRRVFLLLVAVSAVPLVLGIIGVTFMLRSGSSFGEDDVWFRLSLYLFYALGMSALILAARGWMLYWKQPKTKSAYTPH
jgi:hypothetical protein